jgi:hypothetical protein
VESLAAYLESADPLTRRAGIRTLGRAAPTDVQAIHALIRAQFDADPGVAAEALRVLDALQPPPAVAVRGAGVIPAVLGREIAQVLVLPAQAGWRKVECAPNVGPGEVQGDCYVYEEIPALYETQERSRVIAPAGPGWRRADDPAPARAEPAHAEGLAAQRPANRHVHDAAKAGLVTAPHPLAGPLPLEARAGEVWCAVSLPSTTPGVPRHEWRRNDACVVPASAPAVPGPRAPAAPGDPGAGLACGSCGSGGKACGK